MNILTKLTQEAIIYSTCIIAGTVFIMKRLFGRRKVNKYFFDKNKKKITIRSKLFFSDMTKKVEIRNMNDLYKQNAQNMEQNKFMKMKKIVEKISDEFKNSVINKEQKEDKNTKNSLSPTKKDQIFYYLLNNISNMMTENQTKSETR